jgi:hypothetical protein
VGIRLPAKDTTLYTFQVQRVLKQFPYSADQSNVILNIGSQLQRRPRSGFMKFTNVLILVACVVMMAGFAVAAPAQEQITEGSAVAVPSGAPLTEGEIIILLQAKVPGEVIQKFVTTRGVGFVSTKEVSRKILAAGGTVGLIGTINLNQKEDLNAAAENFDPKKKH